MTAVEIDGGIWKGRFGWHTSGKGYKAGCEKQRLAMRFGFHCEHYTPDEITEKNVKEFIEVQRNRIVMEAFGDDRWIMYRFSGSVFGKEK